MRPFRFFFGVSLAVILFFFLARFVVLALIAAAVFSVIFHVSRKIKNFFLNLEWEEDQYYRKNINRQHELSPRFAKSREELFYDFPNKRVDFMTDYHSINVL